MQQSPPDENQIQLKNAIAGDLILNWLPDGTIISANDSLCVCLGKSCEELKRNSFFEVVSDQDHARLADYISTFNAAISRNSIEYRLITENDGPQWYHWRDYHLYNSDLQRHEFISIGHEISEINSPYFLVNRKENFDRLITNLSINFINLEPENLNAEIQKSLQLIGKFAAVDRCYVFLFSKDNIAVDNTFEWCATGIESEMAQMQNWSLDTIPWMNKTISNFEMVHIPNVETLPSEASVEKEILQKQLIKSLVVVPIDFSQKLIGYVGFDSVTYQKNWSDEDLSLLKIFGSILGRAIIQVNYKTELQLRGRFFQKLNEINLSFLNSKDVQEMLDIVVNQLKNIIMADGCFITLWDEMKQRVIPVAASEPFSEAYKNLQILPGEKTVTESVLENEEILIIDNVLESSFLSPRIANSFSTHCLLGIPLIAEKRKLGAILLGFNETHLFSQDEISLAQQSAYLISMALSKQLALEETEKYAQEVEMLRNSGMIVATTLEPELAIDRILDQLEKVVPFDYASVQLLMEGSLEIKAGKGWLTQELIGKRIPIPGDNPNTQVIQHQQPFYFEDVQELFGSYQISPFAHIHSWLGAPLIVHDQIIGMIELEKSDKNFYNNNHVKLASAFADQVSISLNNAQLFKNEQRRVLELDALRDTLFEVSNELELSQLLPAIVRRAVSLLNANGGELALFDANKQELKVVVSQDVANNVTGFNIALGEGLFGKVAETLQTIITQDYSRWEHRLQHYKGEMVRAVIATPLITGKKLLGVIGIARTISTEPFTEKEQNLLSLFAQQAVIAIKNAELFNEVQILTKIDELTGAYNRRGFNELCHRELLRTKRTKQPQSMLMVDIDHFKYVNDQYGHAIGDQILCLLLNELQKNLRETDILCRYGGEEFSILLPETNIQTAQSISERLRMNVANKSFELPNLTLQITISIGISWLPGDQAELDVLLDRSDVAMYQAKRSGRNTVCVYDDPC